MGCIDLAASRTLADFSYFAPGVETEEISLQDIEDPGVCSEAQCIGQSIGGNSSSLASSDQSSEADWALKSPAPAMPMANEIGQRPVYESECSFHTVMCSSSSQISIMIWLLPWTLQIYIGIRQIYSSSLFLLVLIKPQRLTSLGSALRSFSTKAYLLVETVKSHQNAPFALHIICVLNLVGIPRCKECPRTRGAAVTHLSASLLDTTAGAKSILRHAPHQLVLE